jgi:alkylhydroperoxidase family enzyme
MLPAGCGNDGDMDAPRISPLPVDDWDPELGDTVAKMMLGDDGKPINIFATLAHHPKLLKRWLVFASHVLSKSTLSARDRELLILRTGWRCQAPYEWSQHVVIARRCDITDDEIEAVKRGPADPSWSSFDAALLRAADELHDHSRIGDATWATLSERYDTRQLLDAVAAVGGYHLVAMLLNTCGVQLDDDVPADRDLVDVPQVP